MRLRYRLKQDGIVVAGAEGQNAKSEINHYARMYGQDGPVIIEQRINGYWKRLTEKPDTLPTLQLKD